MHYIGYVITSTFQEEKQVKNHETHTKTKHHQQQKFNLAIHFLSFSVQKLWYLLIYCYLFSFVIKE